jgi:ABC-type multidrug transport system permease subunit
MGLVFVAQGMSEDVWREKRQGTLRRALASPCRVSSLLGGKLLAAAGFVALVSAIALATGTALFGLESSRLPLALAWCTFSGAALFTLFVVLQLLASTQRAGSVLTSVVVYPLLMVGGSFFPFEAMPGWMAAIGRYTPNGWALSVLKQVLAGTAEPGGVAAAFLGLTAVSAALFAAAALRVRRSFA